MIGQYYAIEVECPEEARPGQLVFRSNDDEEAIGFVYEVDGSCAEIVLFEPGALPENMVRCMEMPQDYTAMLGEVLTSKAAPEVVAMWRQILSHA